MKKISLSILLVGIMYSLACAQDSLKAVGGNFSTELNINPFKGELSLNNALNQIKVRYFIADNLALRVAFNVNSTKKSNDKSNVYGANPTSFSEVLKSTTLGLNVGFEKHFKGTKRLSPYLGAEMGVASKRSSQDTKSGTSELNVKGGWWTTQYIDFGNGGYYPQINLIERAYTQFGLNAIGGFDYYVARHFYVGYEFAFGFTSTKYKDVEVTKKGTDLPTINDDDVKQKDFILGATVINGVRIGFVF